MTAVQLPLFGPDALPEAAAPVAEWSQEWSDAALLRLVERVRFDPTRLALYAAGDPDRLKFLNFAISQLGGRSQ